MNMQALKRTFLLGALLLTPILACDNNEGGKRANNPTWNFEYDLADGHQYSVSFSRDSTGKFWKYSTMTTLPSGKHYLDSGIPSADDIQSLKQITSSKSLQSLGSNFKATNTEGATQPGMAWISFASHDCAAHCDKTIGVLNPNPDNPHVNTMVKYFTDFIISHRGREAKSSSSAPGSTK